MENKSKKLKKLDLLDEKINELESTLDVVSNGLYDGKEHSEAELINLISKLKYLEDVESFVDETITLNFKKERKLRKTNKIVFGLGMTSYILFGLSSGLIIPAALLVLIHALLNGSIKKDSEEVTDYLKDVSKRSCLARVRIDNYETSTKIKIRKINQDYNDLSETETKIANFGLAEAVVQSLLNGVSVGLIDKDVEALVRVMLKDEGAEGETLEELADDLRNKYRVQMGGKVFKKK